MKNRRNGKFLIVDAVLVLILLLLLFYGQKKGLWGITQKESSPASFAEPASTASSRAASSQPAASSTPVPADTDYVKVKNYIPNLYVDLKYATNENITGHAIYDFVDAYLRYGTVKKLKQVQDELVASGYSLKIWDAYRPMAAQAELWKAEPDPRYISNPKRGPSSHNLGNTVDVTIVAKNGPEIAVPSGFDNFTRKADRDYSDVTADEKKDALLLENTMEKYGFKPYSGEWWHFEDTQDYPYEDFKP